MHACMEWVGELTCRVCMRVRGLHAYMHARMQCMHAWGAPLTWWCKHERARCAIVLAQLPSCESTLHAAMAATPANPTLVELAAVWPDNIAQASPPCMQYI